MIKLGVTIHLNSYFCFELNNFITVSFNAYDKDGSNSISRDELEEMFKYAWMSGFKAMRSVANDEELTMQEIKDFSEECAKSFADSVLSEMDTDGDGIFNNRNLSIFM